MLGPCTLCEGWYENACGACCNQSACNSPGGRDASVGFQAMPCTLHVLQGNAARGSSFRIGQVNDVRTINVILDECERVHAIAEAMGHFGQNAFDR